MKRSGLVFFAMLLGSAAAIADVDKYNITPEEHAACDNDALAYCSGAADEDQLLACMKANVRNLSAMCSTTFLSGLKKRHMAL